MIFVLFLIALCPFYQYPFLPPDSDILVRVAGLAAAVAALFHIFGRKRFPPFLKSAAVFWYLLFLALVVTSFAMNGMSITTPFNPILTHASFLLMLFVIFSSIDTLKRLNRSLFMVVASVSLGGLYLLREWQVARGWSTGYRPGAVVGDDEIYATAAAFAIPVAWVLYKNTRNKLARTFYIGCLTLMIVAVIAGGSRGGLIGVVASLAVLNWTSPKRIRAYAIAIFFLVTFNLAYPYSPFYRIINPTKTDLSNANARMTQWKAGAQMVADHPLIGVGIGRFMSLMRFYIPDLQTSNIAHNMFLAVAAECGIPAVLTLIVLWFSIIRSLNRVCKLRINEPENPLIPFAIGIRAGIVGAIVSSCFIYGLNIRETWLAAFLAMAVVVMAKEHAAKDPEDQEAEKPLPEWQYAG